jgi:hypothetical protein
MRSSLLRVAALLALLLASAVGSAKGPMPLPPLDGARSNLQIRIVRYDGHTNGQMVVEVQNTGSRAEIFSAQGLYFVPEGDPDKAPQRLAAAGPFVIDGHNDARPIEQLQIKPKGKAQLRLPVFCIDSHRASPSPQNAFRVAKERMPRDLRTNIEVRAKAAIKQSGNRPSAAAPAIQSEVWNARNQKWIKLDGERKDERNVQQEPRPSRRPHRLPPNIQQRAE